MTDKDNGLTPEVMGTAMTPPDESISLTDLTDLGLILPLATPERLRKVFAEKQRLYAAILDESDYIYTVSYSENGKQKQNIYARRPDAMKAAKAYGVEARANPKKSGITKLASALGIEAKRKQSTGLPLDVTATHSYVLYEAMHKKTGRAEEGVGWCDKNEPGARSSHVVIATADTRAYNRAVLRLAGFGDVSADEILAGGSDEDLPAVTVIDMSAASAVTVKKPAQLPAPVADEIVLAQRVWAEEAAKRTDGFLPEAQQSNKAARELRAKARRGNDSAARQMGSLGYSWAGTAQDSSSHETFEVEEPTITVADFERVKAAASDPAKPELPTTGTAPGKPEGWDLSGTGSKIEENRTPVDRPVSRPQAAAGVPAASIPSVNKPTARDGSVETITNVQAKNLSEKLLGKLGTKDAAQAWLRKHADVERSALVRQNQYDALIKLLTTKET